MYYVLDLLRNFYYIASIVSVDESISYLTNKEILMLGDITGTEI